MPLAADAKDALHLLAWLTPSFPVGAFAYSHAVETVVDAGDIVDAETLVAWLRDLLHYGSARNDAILVGSAFDAVAGGRADELVETNDLALALSPSRERMLESSSMGNAFASAIRSSWPAAAAGLPKAPNVAYPVAFGAACAGQAITKRSALATYVFAFCQNLVSAAVRLGPIGQTDGQKVIAALVTDMLHLAAEAADATLDAIGGCAQRSDIAAMRHETLYSRLFRS